MCSEVCNTLSFAQELLRAIVSNKLRRNPKDIFLHEPLRNLVDGNSALLNEIISIIAEELNLSESATQGMDRKTIADLAPAFPSCRPGQWSSLRINRYFSSIGIQRSSIVKEVERVLIPEVREEAAALTEVRMWSNHETSIQDTIQCLAKEKNWTMETPKDLDKTDGSTSGRAIDLDGNLKKLSTFLDDMCEQKGCGAIKGQEDSSILDDISEELGDDFMQNISPIFSEKAVRVYQSFWAWQGERTASSRKWDIRVPDGLNVKLTKQENSNCGDKACEMLKTLILQSTLTFAGEQTPRILVTGAGPHSIGEEIVAELLRHGARVVVISHRCDKAAFERYEELYRTNCADKSSLEIIPAQLMSRRDVDAAMSYICKKEPLDAVFPFAAKLALGKVQNIAGAQELCFRLMVTSVVATIGFLVRVNNDPSRYLGHFTKVVLPLSPNTGHFGGDGLYPESKLSLCALLQRAHSEGWISSVGIVGVIIGWTRTPLMRAHDDSAGNISQNVGFQVFSAEDMAIYCTRLLSKEMQSYWLRDTWTVDFSGGLSENISHVPHFLEQVRLASGKEYDAVQSTVSDISASWSSGFPRLEESPMDPKGLPLSLHDVKVVVGFGEIGTWGSARTRWAREMSSSLSPEAVFELCWMSGVLKWNELTGEWIDTHGRMWKETEKTAACMRNVVSERCGIREIDPSQMEDKYNPRKRTVWRDVALGESSRFEWTVSEDEVKQLERLFGGNAKFRRTLDGEIMCSLLQGACIKVPFAMKEKFRVAGQIPSGWKAERVGIFPHIEAQVDPVTVYGLVALSEAFVSAGISDVGDFVSQIGITRIGNTIGTGIGGQRYLRQVFGSYDDDAAQVDGLQECLANVPPAWMNMLLLGAAGPIITPVQACSTAAVSVDAACRLLETEQADFVVCGGSESISEGDMVGFSRMGTLCVSEEEEDACRTPAEASRPCSSSRNGFVNAEGAGIQLITRASVALAHGLPIYSIIGGTATAMDGLSKSVPAPGQGIVGTYGGSYLPSVKERRMALIQDLYYAPSLSIPMQEECQRFWSHRYWKGRVGPLEGTLNEWGLSPNSISFVSMHGTGTKGNDTNECMIIHRLLKELKRTSKCPVVAQKHLTGHAKGASFAFMMHGAMQSLRDRVISGNQNLDDVDPSLRDFSDLLKFSHCKTQMGKDERVVLLHAFGFGQANAQVVLVDPKCLFCELDMSSMSTYRTKVSAREQVAFRTLQNILHDSTPLVSCRNGRSNDMDALMRCSAGISCGREIKLPRMGENDSNLKLVSKCEVDNEAQLAVLTQAGILQVNQQRMNLSALAGLGIDVQRRSCLPVQDDRFREMNYTERERSLLKFHQLANNWAAKEAIMKSYGCRVSMSNIEVLREESGAPVACILDHPSVKFAVSISYDGDWIVAVAVCNKDGCSG